jgi:ADP-heptose:LPS heptosyltransferase
VFDEIIELDFPEDSAQRQRIMDFDAQEALIERLKPYKFDVAIDFVVNGTSKRLVAMTGATVTMGFGNDDSKTYAMDIVTNDPLSNNDIAHHSVRMMMLVKSLELWMRSDARIVQREDLTRETLTEFGVAPDERYVLIHSGSRITFTRWQHYVELAKKIIAELGLKVVFMADDESMRPRFAEEEAAGRLVYLARKLPFDQFDSLISFASVFVGNDSGPKHLAALRGTPVVSLHSSRISWIEWGQEQTGVIISRQVPCAGCGLHHDPEECAQDVACMKYIKIEEVFREVRNLLDAAAPDDRAIAATEPA